MFIIADGNNLAWAGYHALRRSMASETPAQKVRCALLGLTQSVIGLVIRGGEPPIAGRPEHTASMFAGKTTRLAVVFDQGRPIRRRAIYPPYQTGRESDPSFMENEDHVVEAIRQFSEMATLLPATIARGLNTEADDLISFLALAAPGPVRIASTDRDFLQLVDERVTIYSTVKRVVIDVESFDAQAAPRTARGEPVIFPRERYLDYRAASGDSSDDLPGIPGLGTIGAARLLAAAPLDAYLADPALAAQALGRQNAKLAASLTSGAAAAIVARNRALMDLRAAAARYESIDDMLTVGHWDEAVFRAWVAHQRIAGLEVESAVRALTPLAG